MSRYLTTLATLALLLAAAGTCSPTPAPPPEAAVTYCGSCHRLPDPQELPRRVWAEEVLPDMGAWLGIYPENDRQGYLIKKQPAAEAMGLFPVEPRLDSTEWAAIVNHYLAEAPEAMPPLEAEALPVQTRFRVTPVETGAEDDPPPLVTYLGWSAEDRQIVVGSADRQGGYLSIFGPAHRPVAYHRTASPPTDYDPATETVLEVGSLYPTDQPVGRLARVETRDVIQDGLLRPTKMLRVDLDVDGRPELVIGEFGYVRGRLSRLLENEDGGLAEAEPLEARPGAVQLRAMDVDGDGAEDLVVLYGQGDESVVAYLARPGGPQRRLLLRFPPTYGSSDLEVADVNADGHPDLVVTNGDNFDYTPVPKPYHGVRIYENDGEGNFVEAYFYPLDGAYNVEVADFNGDGMTDLAAVAYFVPPELRERHRFVYLERLPGKPYAFAARGLAPGVGRHFMTMTSGDVDGDGDTDLLLGNFASYLPESKIITKAADGGSLPLYFYLENTAPPVGK